MPAFVHLFIISHLLREKLPIIFQCNVFESASPFYSYGNRSASKNYGARIFPAWLVPNGPPLIFRFGGKILFPD